MKLNISTIKLHKILIVWNILKLILNETEFYPLILKSLKITLKSFIEYQLKITFLQYIFTLHDQIRNNITFTCFRSTLPHLYCNIVCDWMRNENYLKFTHGGLTHRHHTVLFMIANKCQKIHKWIILSSKIKITES